MTMLESRGAAFGVGVAVLELVGLPLVEAAVLLASEPLEDGLEDEDAEGRELKAEVQMGMSLA
jgi:hypothetical protein